MQPGQMFTPSGSQPEPTQDEPENQMQIDHTPAVPQNDPAPPQPQPETFPQAPPEPTPLPVPEPQPATPPEPDNSQQSSAHEAGLLAWTASEFIEHQKPQGWYLTVMVGAAVVSAILYFILRDIVTVVVVAIAAIMFAIVGARKPRALSYTLSQKGIQIGDKAFTYDKFKSFSLIEEGAVDSIQLMPLQRFMPPISLYFPPEQEEQIMDLLGNYLPHEDKPHDPIDRLMKRFHF